MDTIAINANQFEKKVIQIYKEEQVKLMEEKWNSFDKYEKMFIVEFLKEFYLNKKTKLNESKWYNTLGDIVGVFDPTGSIDAINAMSYFKQGDTLYGIMSLISAVPYIGDVVGKPIIGVLKYGGGAARLMRGAKTSTQWGKLGNRYKVIGKLLEKIGQIGPALMEIIKKIPGGKRFSKIIEKWVTMLTEASRLSKGAKTVSATGKLTSAEFRMFRDYGLGNSTGLLRFLKKGGFQKNRQLSGLLGKTKFWLGFLDLVGVANFVGPEEVEKQMGSEEYNRKMEEYANSPEGQKKWDEEFRETTGQSDQQITGNQTNKENLMTNTAKSVLSNDPILSLFF